MKAFLKTLIGGALGVGALYVVGKICYEAGKDVAEVERQLEKSNSESDSPIDIRPAADEGTTEHAATLEKKTLFFDDKQVEETVDENQENSPKQTALGKLVNKAKNAKMFLAVKKTFDKQNRSPGILGSLLTNPDGAKIEAFVRDGGVQISVKPRAA